MFLTERPPSLNWELLSLDQSGQSAVWVWYRPAAVPNGVIVVIPGGAFADPRTAGLLSVRQLVVAAGLDPAQMVGWSVNGLVFDAAGGASAMLDQALPAPPPEGHAQLTVWMQVPEISFPVASPGVHAPAGATAPVVQSAGPSPAGDERLFVAIDACWNGIRQLETKVGGIRKQLDQAMARLNSLNRDLTPEERRASDNKDTKDWLDARRWLRDSLATLSRFTKEIDMGTTSGAGQRHRLEDLYQQYVVPRIPFAGLEHAVIEYETHAKILQNLVASAQSGLTRAGRDAEQRANGVLMRIAAKSRSSRR